MHGVGAAGVPVQILIVVGPGLLVPGDGHGVHTIRDELGIHARPAGQLAKVAKSFEPTVISITKEGKTVKASQLMKLMGLSIKKGHEITITVEGEREEEAAAAMKKFLEENL